MTYFSRLTDIVTCNLSEILAREAEPAAALRAMLGEMDEGLNGARRSVATASANVERLEREIEEHRTQTVAWTDRAMHELGTGNEQAARLALVRKSEIDDVIAGLEQQHKAAVSTREHLATTMRALEARRAEAGRKLQQLEAGQPADAAAMPTATAAETALPADASRRDQIEAELEQLRRRLQETRDTSNTTGFPAGR